MPFFKFSLLIRWYQTINNIPLCFIYLVRKDKRKQKDTTVSVLKKDCCTWIASRIKTKQTRKNFLFFVETEKSVTFMSAASLRWLVAWRSHEGTHEQLFIQTQRLQRPTVRKLSLPLSPYSAKKEKKTPLLSHFLALSLSAFSPPLLCDEWKVWVLHSLPGFLSQALSSWTNSTLSAKRHNQEFIGNIYILRIFSFDAKVLETKQEKGVCEMIKISV